MKEGVWRIECHGHTVLHSKRSHAPTNRPREAPIYGCPGKCPQICLKSPMILAWNPQFRTECITWLPKKEISRDQPPVRDSERSETTVISTWLYLVLCNSTWLFQSPLPTAGFILPPGILILRALLVPWRTCGDVVNTSQSLFAMSVRTFACPLPFTNACGPMW